MLLPRFERFKPHTDTDLVYLKSSPDYCEFDVKRGSLGTHGRECDHVSRLNLHFIFCMKVFYLLSIQENMINPKMSKTILKTLSAVPQVIKHKI